MSIVYSNHSHKYIDTDHDEVFYLHNGDCVSTDDTIGLLEAYHEGNISEEDMIDELCFDKEDLVE